LPAAFAVVPAVEPARLVPLSPGGWGAVEAGAAAALAARPLGLEHALGVAVVLHLVETGAGVAFGLASTAIFATRRLRSRDVGVPAVERAA
jgi:uncharacterized membrane protein YbhN (UPF0104 family)